MKKTLSPALAVGIAAAALASGASSAQAAPGVYYANCAAAIRAQAAPILATEPGYRVGLDRDRDGVACDKNLPAGYVKKAPAKPAPSRPAPGRPAPVVQAPATHAPAKPAQPAPATPGAPAAGPVVQTDYVKTSNGASNTLAAVGLFAAAGTAGALRVRALKR